MKGKLYAIQITRRHLDLVTLINGGLTPDESVTKGKHWLVFELEENGKDSVNHQIMPERALFGTHDILSGSPLILRVKE